MAVDPTAGVARPRVDPDYTATVGLSREQGRALIAAADADLGRARLRSAAVIRLLLHNALRVDEALGADIADLGSDRGHQVLTVLGKGNRRAKVALTPGTLSVLHAYLEDRATAAGVGSWRGMGGPLLATTSGGADAAQSAVGARAPPRGGCGDRGGHPPPATGPGLAGARWRWCSPLGAMPTACSSPRSLTGSGCPASGRAVHGPARTGSWPTRPTVPGRTGPICAAE
nr:transposase DDE domain protein [uncultured bacterium]